MWKPEEVISFAMDCVAHGIKAVSLGGGEPFEYEGLIEIIDALYPICYLSITTRESGGSYLRSTIPTRFTLLFITRIRKGNSIG